MEEPVASRSPAPVDTSPDNQQVLTAESGCAEEATRDDSADNTTRSREATPIADGAYVPTPPAVHGHTSVLQHSSSASESGVHSLCSVTTAESWRGSIYEHPLTAATSAMLDIQTSTDAHSSNQHSSTSAPAIYEVYSYGASGSPPLSVAATTSAIMLNPHISTHLTSTCEAACSGGGGADMMNAAPELGILLTNPSDALTSATSTAVPTIVKREAEDLTAERRSPVCSLTLPPPASLEDRRTAVIMSCGNTAPVVERFSSPQHQQQSPLSVLHSGNGVVEVDSPAGRDLSPPNGLSSGQYGGASVPQYTTLPSVHMYTDSSQYASLMPPSPSSYTSVNSTAGAATGVGSSNGAQIRSTSGDGGAMYGAAGSDAYYYPLEPYAPSTAATVASVPVERPSVVYGPASDCVADPHVHHQQHHHQQHHHQQYMERYVRPVSGGGYKLIGHNLTVDLPSPDSGIGADATTPRADHHHQHIQQQASNVYEYTDICVGGAGSVNGSGQMVAGSGALLPVDAVMMRPESTTPTSCVGQVASGPSSNTATPHSVTSARSWHDFGRQAEVDKIHIPKIYSNYGFRFFLETPISTSQRREDDRMTYVNKGQFYGITMEYAPDTERQLKNCTVKSVILLVFREEKPIEDEMKSWQFWHSRQHSVKQRILDVDTKNSIGLVGSIEELAHNAVAVYWNPLESSAKISIAVQCLSTDFSSQKGVKGLPLHIQIDTYEDYRDPSCAVSHRAYVQVKSFCDKGAERKTRDEERRACKRKMTVSGRKKMEELYHPNCDRSEFYSMADLIRPPILFQPSEDEPEKQLGTMELQNYYCNSEPDHNICMDAGISPANNQLTPPADSSAPFKFHYGFPHSVEEASVTTGAVLGEGPKDAEILYSASSVKRPRLSPSPNQRLMLYVRQEQEELYTPLHVVPPTTMGLLHAISTKYKIASSCVRVLCRRNRKGVTATMDDQMLMHYCNEDTFLLEICQPDLEGPYDITLVKIDD